MPFEHADILEFAARYAAAWCSGNPDAVAAHFAADGSISVNRSDRLVGQQAISEMAAGFYAEFPDLVVLCDEVRSSGSHVLFLWTLEGHHSETENYVRVGGWEEWELDEDLKIKSSNGWFDANDYDRQIAGK